MSRWKAGRSAIAGAVALIAAAVGAHAEICPGAVTVTSAASAFVSAARAGSPAAFSALLTRYTNVEALAIFALGRYRAKLPPERRAEYIRNTQYYLGRFLADNSGRFNDSSKLTIESCKGNLVTTSFKGGSNIIWRVSGTRIDDVQVSGFWLTLALRDKFANVVRQNHGYVSSLLDFLARQAPAEARQKKS
jgi:ABC-type transporter MlaC component